MTRTYTKSTPEQIAQARTLRNEGWKQSDIAELTGMSQVMVSYYVGKRTGPGRGRIPQTVIDEIISLRKQGAKFEAIIAATGVSAGTVSRVLTEVGLNGHRFVYSPEEIENARKLRSFGLTYGEISAATGMSLPFIGKKCRDVVITKPRRALNRIAAIKDNKVLAALKKIPAWGYAIAAGGLLAAGAIATWLAVV